MNILWIFLTLYLTSCCWQCSPIMAHTYLISFLFSHIDTRTAEKKINEVCATFPGNQRYCKLRYCVLSIRSDNNCCMTSSWHWIRVNNSHQNVPSCVIQEALLIPVSHCRLPLQTVAACIYTFHIFLSMWSWWLPVKEQIQICIFYISSNRIEFWDTYGAHGARRAPSWHLVAVTAALAPPASEASPAPTHAAGYWSPARSK